MDLNSLLMGGLANTMEGDFWKSQQDQEKMRQQNIDWENKRVKSEMLYPEEVAESNLARMTAQADAELLPKKKEVEAQNIDAERNFNLTREMLALLDDESVDDVTKDHYLQKGMDKLLGTPDQPTLKDAQTMARREYMMNYFKQNPTKFKEMLANKMNAYSRSLKSQQALEMQGVKSHNQQTLELLKGQVKQDFEAFKAKTGGDIKTLEHYSIKQMQNAIANGRPDLAQEWMNQVIDVKTAAAIQSAEKTSRAPTVELGAGGPTVVQKEAPATPRVNLAKNAKPVKAGTESSVAGRGDLAAAAAAEIARRQAAKEGK